MPSIPAIAAPRGEQSGICAALTSSPVISAMNCMRNALRVAPPSAWIALQFDAGAGAHQVEHIAHLIRDRFQRGTDEMIPIRVRTHPDDRSTRTRRPVRRAQSRERRDEIDTAIIRDGASGGFGFLRTLNQPQLILQPRNRRRRVADDPLERIRRLPLVRPRDRRDRTFTEAQFRADVQQERTIRCQASPSPCPDLNPR